LHSEANRLVDVASLLAKNAVNPMAAAAEPNPKKVAGRKNEWKAF
jgi:hypothetical protein